MHRNRVDAHLSQTKNNGAEKCRRPLVLLSKSRKGNVCSYRNNPSLLGSWLLCASAKVSPKPVLDSLRKARVFLRTESNPNEVERFRPLSFSSRAAFVLIESNVSLPHKRHYGSTLKWLLYFTNLKIFRQRLFFSSRRVMPKVQIGASTAGFGCFFLE